jgi:hypothetical protein
VLTIDAARHVVEDVVRGELHDVGQPLLELRALLAAPDAVEEERRKVLERELVHLVDVALVGVGVGVGVEVGVGFGVGFGLGVWVGFRVRFRFTRSAMTKYRMEPRVAAGV